MLFLELEGVAPRPGRHTVQLGSAAGDAFHAGPGPWGPSELSVGARRRDSTGAPWPA